MGRPVGGAQLVWERIRGATWWRDPVGMLALLVVALFIVVAVFGPLVEPYAPNKIAPLDAFAPPSHAHWFGTDDLGRDTLSRVLDAARVAALVGVIAVAIALVAGGILGLIAGYYGRWVESMIMGAMDVVFAFPALLLAIMVVAVLGTGAVHAALALGVVYTPRYARIARASTLSLRTRPFIHAAKLAGVRDAGILLRHVVPNSLSPLIVLTALSLSTAQMAYAALSFLGLGAEQPQADYGSMLATARDYMVLDPWLVLFPAAALVLLVVSLNILGDSVRDWLDPRHQGRGVPSEDRAVVAA